MSARVPLYLGSRGGEPVEFSGEGSLLTVGPPGTGKSRGVAAPNLFACSSSVVVTDPKGELAQWTAEHRRARLGQSVAVLDPFEITGMAGASINPLAPLVAVARVGRGLRAEAERLAHMLLPDLAGPKDPYWRQGGRSLLVVGLLFLAVLDPERCHLPGLYDVLWRDEEDFVRSVLDPMNERGGALSQFALNVASAVGKRPKEFGIFRAEAREALSIFANDEPCGFASLSSSLDFAELLTGKLSVYLVLPPDKVASHGRWMGLVVAHAIQSIMQAREAGECLFLLDEFPNLGRLPDMLGAVAQLRGKGVRFWPFVQDLAQLESVYGRDEARALKGQAEVMQVLGCRSVELAQEIEARAGKRTATMPSLGLPDPGEPAGPLRPGLSLTGLPVLPAAAVLAMPKGQQILIRHGFPPIVAEVTPWTGG